MKESAKFKQANREAKATVMATVLVILFWCAAGFGENTQGLTGAGAVDERILLGRANAAGDATAKEGQ